MQLMNDFITDNIVLSDLKTNLVTSVESHSWVVESRWDAVGYEHENGSKSYCIFDSFC